jgi:hypothetical protein
MIEEYVILVLKDKENKDSPLLIELNKYVPLILVKILIVVEEPSKSKTLYALSIKTNEYYK